MKRVVIISTSLRVRSNSDLLAEQFMKGAESAGHQVEKVELLGKQIAFCRGCFACAKLGRCIIDDDVNGIMEKVMKADVIVWATPIYYYEMSGQIKTLIDRMNAMYDRDYRFREVYLLTTAAEDEDSVPQPQLYLKFTTLFPNPVVTAFWVFNPTEPPFCFSLVTTLITAPNPMLEYWIGGLV